MDIKRSTCFFCDKIKHFHSEIANQIYIGTDIKQDLLFRKNKSQYRNKSTGVTNQIIIAESFEKMQPKKFVLLQENMLLL